jgi:hypothetical protein
MRPSLKITKAKRAASVGQVRTQSLNPIPQKNKTKKNSFLLSHMNYDRE